MADSDLGADVRAGVAIYNAGRHHAAHDAWERRWLSLEAGEDERFLHGLIQFTAAVHHAHEANWTGLRGLAESAADYLADLPGDYRGVNVGTVRAYLVRVAADPEHVERVAPPPLTYGDDRLTLAGLDPAAALAAAPALAEADGYDEGVLARAVEYARAELAEGEHGRFAGLVGDFVRETDRRGLVHRRLAGHVERRAAEEHDVEGLFD